MTYLICSLLAGVVLYAVVLAVLPSAHRADLSKWQDMFAIAACASLEVVFYILWSVFLLGRTLRGAQLSCSHSSRTRSALISGCFTPVGL